METLKPEEPGTMHSEFYETTPASLNYCTAELAAIAQGERKHFHDIHSPTVLTLKRAKDTEEIDP